MGPELAHRQYHVGKTTMAERPIATGFVRTGSLSQNATECAGSFIAFGRKVGPHSGPIDWAMIQPKFKVKTVYDDEDVMVLGVIIVDFLDNSPVKILVRAGW